MKTLALIASLCLAILSLQAVFAQDAPTAADPQTGAVLVKLAPLTYPPLSRQARIQGDVKVNIHIRPDGSIASIELFSGHPMLAPAAVENAEKSEYECRGCTAETEYMLTYTFGFIEDLAAYDKFEDKPIRTAKCVYLWKCATVRVKTSDYCTANIPPQISRTSGHVRLIVLPECVQALDTYTSR